MLRKLFCLLHYLNIITIETNCCSRTQHQYALCTQEC